MIAKIIVDVPSGQTDRTFDYDIPEEWGNTIEIGMRVVVSFGPRKVQGFVVETTNDTTANKKLKPISEVLDPAPVLTQELVDLGFWLSQRTLCFQISAYQAMIPAAMRASYKKVLRLSMDINLDQLPIEVSRWFTHREAITWDEITETAPHHIRLFQQEIKKKRIDVSYHVKDHVTKKKVKVVKLAIEVEQIDEAIQQIGERAKKQQQILAYFQEYPDPISVTHLIERLETTRSTIKGLVAKGYLLEEEIEISRDPYAHKTFSETSPLPLTPMQQKVINPIYDTIEKKKHTTFLLHGVTGSGKTEIYLQSIDRVLRTGKEAIVLVPEISLTPQMVDRFKGRFGSLVAVLHSGLSKGEKYDEWRKIQRNDVKVVVGARSAIFAPFENLGIIIIDEEHEGSYKQEENPRYHARDVAIYRGEYHQCPVVLGSATPSLESYARAKKNVYHLLPLLQRVNELQMPSVEIVDMREELRNGNRSMFSTVLFQKLNDRLEKGEQSVLFLNRRGYSTFVMCRDCGYVVECQHCDISLTYHRTSHSLKCHYCGHQESMPSKCHSCESEHIRFFGSGTQKVEEELTKVLPGVRVVRMDVDTTRKKGAHERLLQTFASGQADILLGTQMIAKGLDFPKVTLVGVLAADSILHIPDFRASERTFQLLTQVSGRAGRHQLPGEVVIQSYTPEHYSITLAGNHDFLSFYEREMMVRKQHGYPPFYFLTLITISHQELTKVIAVAEKITTFLKQELSNQTIVLGPIASPIPRIKDRYRYQCMIKYKTESKLSTLLKEIIVYFKREISQEQLMISIDMNPQMLM
ncbi:primosomal protein N' [Anaerobacillus sp. MEB173]|uniref:primosomal protein N' n=1 Tax=Anaerobacillus sp. MEB173 TaxID=3383345 RepID=UPI003F93EEC4